jgi:hypothetical protein
MYRSKKQAPFPVPRNLHRLYHDYLTVKTPTSPLSADKTPGTTPESHEIRCRFFLVFPFFCS